MEVRVPLEKMAFGKPKPTWINEDSIILQEPHHITFLRALTIASVFSVELFMSGASEMLMKENG